MPSGEVTDAAAEKDWELYGGNDLCVDAAESGEVEQPSSSTKLLFPRHIKQASLAVAEWAGTDAHSAITTGPLHWPVTRFLNNVDEG